MDGVVIPAFHSDRRADVAPLVDQPAVGRAAVAAYEVEVVDAIRAHGYSGVAPMEVVPHGPYEGTALDLAAQDVPDVLSRQQGVDAGLLLVLLEEIAYRLAGVDDSLKKVCRKLEKLPEAAQFSVAEDGEPVEADAGDAVPGADLDMAAKVHVIELHDRAVQQVADILGLDQETSSATVFAAVRGNSEVVAVERDFDHDVLVPHGFCPPSME